MTVAPGATKKIVFELEPEAFALWNAENAWGAEPSIASIWVGRDSSVEGGVKLEIGE